ncbi:hypothetical protein Q4F19_17935 [Sphingomonas sp. BIUV-7]|uniref:Uncharacterized protein n=1 Tax=Sphingomonas natans TaxID=3063330 RepID=A0ABT8YD28_9SPHN|nr:hypothetical protein [Sphingomonas sp. BIUV-7]MDO6416271.1 hypothetical protein [Sphingomonas sp. BIUV-7]
MPAPAKLSDREVVEIRNRLGRPCSYCGAPPSLSDIAARFGVSRVMIWKIVHARGRLKARDSFSDTGKAFGADASPKEVAKWLEDAGISWSDADQLRLAAQVITIAKVVDLE